MSERDFGNFKVGQLVKVKYDSMVLITLASRKLAGKIGIITKIGIDNNIYKPFVRLNIEDKGCYGLRLNEIELIKDTKLGSILYGKE